MNYNYNFADWLVQNTVVMHQSDLSKLLLLWLMKKKVEKVQNFLQQMYVNEIFNCCN